MHSPQTTPVFYCVSSRCTVNCTPLPAVQIGCFPCCRLWQCNSHLLGSYCTACAIIPAPVSALSTPHQLPLICKNSHL
eukprot:IDg14246t1